MMLLSLLAGGAGGCGDDYTTSDSATVGSTGGSAESVLCANPQFNTGGGVGALYECAGSIAAGSIQYTVRSHYEDWEDTESAPIDGEQLQDPTDGGCSEPVMACCSESVEALGPVAGPAEVALACHSDCAHRACQKLLDELGTLRAEPVLPNNCNIGPCVDNVKLSWNHYYGFLMDNFDLCVSAVLGDDQFGFGDPPCGDGMGCLRQARITLDCQIETNSVVPADPGGNCSEAPNHPPAEFEPECALGSGVVHVSNPAGSTDLDIVGGAVKYSNFYCEKAGCPFVIRELDVHIDDFTHAGQLIHDISVSLHTPAIGHSVGGTNVVFVPGSIRIDVSAQVTDAAGTTSFSGTTSNLSTTGGALMGGVFRMKPLEFQAGGYTFELELESEDCESELPYCWAQIDLAPYDTVIPTWIKVDPSDDEVLYVGHTGGVLISDNGGEEWDVFLTVPWIDSDEFVFDPQDSSKVYFANGDEVLTYDGNAFSLEGDVPFGIRSLYVSPSDGSVYVTVQTPLSTDTAAVYKQTAGVGAFVAKTIQPTEYEDPIAAIDIGLIDPYSPTLIGWTLVEDVANGVLYFGGEIDPEPGSDGHEYDTDGDPSEHGYDAPNVRSVNGGAWENINGGVITHHVTSFAVDPATSRVYALEEGGLLVKSDSFGVCWDVVSEPPDSPQFILDPNAAKRFFVGPWYDGVYVSVDGGAHYAAAGLQGLHTPNIALNSSSSRLYATGMYIVGPSTYVSDGVWATVPCP